jgi:hypothetical protein
MTKNDEREPGRGRGNLETDCFDIVSKVLGGKLDLPEGKRLTPTVVGNLIKEQDGLDKAPSTGAVDANFVRWGNYGVVTLGATPRHIKGFTAAFTKAGGDKAALAEFKAKHRASLKAAKPAGEKAPAKPAAKKAPAKKAAAKKNTGARKPAAAKKAASDS